METKEAIKAIQNQRVTVRGASRAELDDILGSPNKPINEEKNSSAPSGKVSSHLEVNGAPAAPWIPCQDGNHSMCGEHDYGHGGIRVECNCECHAKDAERARKDMQLRNAAPALYTALKALIEACTAYRGEQALHGVRCPSQADVDEARNALALVEKTSHSEIKE